MWVFMFREMWSLLVQILFYLYKLSTTSLKTYHVFGRSLWWYKSWALIFSMYRELWIFITWTGKFLSVCARAVKIYFFVVRAAGSAYFLHCVFTLLPNSLASLWVMDYFLKILWNLWLLWLVIYRMGPNFQWVLRIYFLRGDIDLESRVSVRSISF